MVDGIFVDIDNTLVYSTYWDMSPAWIEAMVRGVTCHSFDHSNPDVVQQVVCGEFDKAFSHDCSVFVSRLRPGAIEFLAELRKISPRIYALSAGIRSFQVEAMTAHGIMGMLDELYGRESLGSRDAMRVVPALPKTILVDDQPCLSMLAISKLDVMGVLTSDNYDDMVKAFDKHYVHISAFEGQLPDEALKNILPKVQAKAEAL
jgi:hypothetical protein